MDVQICLDGHSDVGTCGNGRWRASSARLGAWEDVRRVGAQACETAGRARRQASVRGSGHAEQRAGRWTRSRLDCYYSPESTR
ncbi:hypothetical protein CRG98_029762 [Punica granatum]|uniref:Uncharacterized protein n=1 Tax=Punica granatum TaxID=22663 RepID=A0A2I0J0S5_PUNGR|nr:hypothetical protein CRG98_029762 [Punica granatum]